MRSKGRLCVNVLKNFIKTVKRLQIYGDLTVFFEMAAVRHLDDYWRPLFRNPSKARVNLDIAVRAQQRQGWGLRLGLVFGG